MTGTESVNVLRQSAAEEPRLVKELGMVDVWLLTFLVILFLALSRSK